MRPLSEKASVSPAIGVLAHCGNDENPAMATALGDKGEYCSYISFDPE